MCVFASLCLRVTQVVTIEQFPKDIQLWLTMKKVRPNLRAHACIDRSTNKHHHTLTRTHEHIRHPPTDCNGASRFVSASCTGQCKSPRFLEPQTSNLKSQTSNLKPQTSNLKPQTSNLKPQTSNLKPQTSNLKPKT